jgi:hypothetical protein
MYGGYASLPSFASRPARAGEKLVTTRFKHSAKRGFAAASEPEVAVCLSPGTEVAFKCDVQYYRLLGIPRGMLAERVARFREIDKHRPNARRDALEFPSGRVLTVDRLCENQHLTVLQLPVPPQIVRFDAREARRTWFFPYLGHR